MDAAPDPSPGPSPVAVLRRGDDMTPATTAAVTGPIAIVDDHRLFAVATHSLLGHLGVEAAVVTAPTLDGLREQLIAMRPAVVLLDFHLGELGVTAPLIRPLVTRGLAVVVLTWDPDAMTRAQCFEAGAAAVLGKGTTPDVLVEALAGAEAGARLITDDERFALISRLRRQRTRRRLIDRRFGRLTPREREVLVLLCQGLGAAEIAEASYVSLTTVRAQIRSVLAKLEVHSQLAAVVDAYRNGWVDRPGPDSSILTMTAPA